MSDCFGKKIFAKLFTSVVNNRFIVYKPDMEIINLELFNCSAPTGAELFVFTIFFVHGPDFYQLIPSIYS
jgi:hypothetical protein